MADNVFAKDGGSLKSTYEQRYTNPGTGKVDPYISINYDLYDRAKPEVDKPPKGGSTGGGTTTPTTGGGYDQLNDLYNQRMQAAYDAYNRGIDRLNGAYNTAANNYGNIYNKGVGTLQNSYKNSLNKINDNAQQSMQEAYINKMLSQKNLSQQLAAQGLSGGASESATAGLINNYGNARNGIQRTWDSNRSDLENTLQQNINNLYSAYQSQMANLDMNRANAINNLENMLANRQANASDSWFNALMSNPSLLNNAVSSTAAKQSAYTPTATEATNIVNSVNTTQANDQGAVSQAARAKALEDMANANGTQINNMLGNYLTNRNGFGANGTSALDEMLRQLYG